MMKKVIHVPFTWFPAPVGGTEVYVRALIRELNLMGWENIVAHPADSAGIDELDGVTVVRIEFPKQFSQSVMYGGGEPESAARFAEYLGSLRPDLVHFHAFTPVISCLWLLAAQRLGIPCVYTYHTPTLTCARGTLMRWGEFPCAGEMQPHDCAGCALHGLGVPKTLASVLTWVSPLTRFFNRRVPFRIKPLITQRTKAVQIWLQGMTQIMALCEWGRQVMILNGVEASRLSVVRHALAVKGKEMESGVNGISTSVPRLGFFGRMDSTKGLHILVEALSLVPDLPIELHAHLIEDSTALDGMSQLLVQMQRDKRIHLHDAVTPDEVVSTMSRYDAVAVPSIWLETGPLVVLEAFAAGVPVLGSDLGGIAEWVRHEVDGILVPSGDARAWSAVLSRWSQDADLRETLRKSVRPPPLMNRLAREVQDIYYKAIGQA